jgi:translation initiation factor 2 beta subunit (eIF-2beta)/eIF-5
MSEKNMLNVGLLESQHDQHHRWKMPPMETAKTGRGRDQKTNLVNVEKVATCIGRSCDARFLLKFLSLEMNTSTGPAGTYYLKGVHDPNVIQRKVFDYIKYFALCPDCGKPRIKLSASKAKKSHKIGYKCGACGNRGTLKGHHKNSGKMLKYISNILKTEKQKNSKQKLDPKRETSKPPVVLGIETEEVVEAFTDQDFEEWVMDPDPARQEIEREKEAAKPKPISEEPKGTPRELLRRILNDPNALLLDRTSELQRILSARRIEDEMKITRIVVDSTLDFSSEDTLMDTIQLYGVFLSWFCEDQERALMLLSLLCDGLFNEGLTDEISKILESLHDNRVLSPELLFHWNNLPADRDYILSASDVLDIKQEAEPFMTWLKENYSNDI